MLTEQRQHAILQLLNEKGSVTVAELKELLNISESTARRDITQLARMGKLEKVFGGAISHENNISTNEPTVRQKSEIHKDEKRWIAAYAASLIRTSDFVYIDAGTTTEGMIDYLPDDNSVSYVTNGVAHAQKLMAAGRKVILIGGELKSSTEAVVGTNAVLMLQKYHFSRGFFGSNGVSLEEGFTTPDPSEALVKQTAIQQCHHPYVLADSSKFDIVSSVTFCAIDKAQILTERIPEKYNQLENVTRV
ncbi:MAG: DeoR/GlpR family DNA-binding transcription regulator [Lachnospiraceae bacterium]|nr:DeoR/GlpR family DNA-binding transcription regulator [Lachnospiraceae bacterium]